ncbi:uncharacterized protein LOC119104861 [Pollicipes pollicipes]|uniref:uncharacterized protein LOC119104861 n=1 Tax=Pollicipes pollicipes TaxID=41117 RepID=UPI0018858CB0|nr:uncharacterized protein LOC119104861 [Pollicipes pollicipes]
MKISHLIILALCLLTPCSALLNFVGQIVNFLAIRSLLENWEYALPVGGLIVLTAIAGGQYGHLPIKSSYIAKKVARLVGPSHLGEPLPYKRSGRVGRDIYRQQHEAVLDTVVRAVALLEEAMRQHGAASSATWRKSRTP